MGPVTIRRVWYAFLCDDVRQEIGGKVSFMGVFGKFGVSDFEQPVNPFYLTSLWLFDDRMPKAIFIDIQDPDGKLVRERLSIETRELADVRNEFNAYPLALYVAVSNLKFERAGRHFFSLRLGEEEIERLPFLVEKT